MDFLQLAKDQRYSVRKFKDQAVEKEKLDLILVSGMIPAIVFSTIPLME